MLKVSGWSRVLIGPEVELEKGAENLSSVLRSPGPTHSTSSHRQLHCKAQPLKPQLLPTQPLPLLPSPRIPLLPSSSFHLTAWPSLLPRTGGGEGNQLGVTPVLARDKMGRG